MRWEHLFDDLESQLEQELEAEDVDLLAEEERLRLGRLTLRDRLRGMRTRGDDVAPLRIELADRSRLDVAIVAMGRDWIAGEVASAGRGRTSCVIPISAIAGCLPDARQLRASMAPAPAEPVSMGTLGTRLGFGFVLRDLCRRRVPVGIGTLSDRLTGTIDRVARDHLDLAEHDPDEPRRSSAVRAHRILPLSRIVLVRF